MRIPQRIARLTDEITARRILPLFILTLLIAVFAVFGVIRVVGDSLRARHRSEVVSAGQFVAEEMVQTEQARLDTLSAVINEPDVSAAVAAADADSLAVLVPQIVLGSEQVDAVALVGIEGVELFGWEQTGVDAGVTTQGRDFSGMSDFPLVQRQIEDERGLPRSMLWQQSDGWYLYTLGPIVYEGRLVGVALVGSDLEQMVSRLGETGIGLVAVYNKEGEVLASSLGRPEQWRAVLADARPTSGLAEEGIARGLDRYRWITENATEQVLVERLAFLGEDYLLAYGDWRVREESVGFYSVAQPIDFALLANPSNANLLGLGLSLVIVAVFLGAGLNLASTNIEPGYRPIFVSRMVVSLLVATMFILTVAVIAGPPGTRLPAASLLPESGADYEVAQGSGLFAAPDPDLLAGIAGRQATSSPTARPSATGTRTGGQSGIQVPTPAFREMGTYTVSIRLEQEIGVTTVAELVLLPTATATSTSTATGTAEGTSSPATTEVTSGEPTSTRPASDSEGATGTSTPTVTGTASRTPTPTASSSVTGTPSPSPRATGTPPLPSSPTNTPVAATATPLPGSPTATDTAVPATATIATATSTSTNTAVPPTVTMATAAPTATNTNTPVPPTATTVTVAPTATNTPALPTATAVPPTAAATNTPVPAPSATSAPPPPPTDTPVPPPTETFTPEPTAAPALQPVSPSLSCVRDNGDGTYTAVWGYNNPNPVTVNIPIGGKNHFVPDPQAQGQPTSFGPGSGGGFTTTFAGDNSQTWKLDGGAASADSGSRGC